MMWSGDTNVTTLILYAQIYLCLLGVINQHPPPYSTPLPFYLSPTHHHLFRCIYVDMLCALVNLVFCHPIIAVTVETTYYGITILQGDDVTLSYRPSESDITLLWSHNGSDIRSSPQYQFNPPLLNQVCGRKPRAPGFLKLFWSACRYACVCVSVCLCVCPRGH